MSRRPTEPRRPDARKELGRVFRETGMPLGSRLVMMAMLTYANHDDWASARASQVTLAQVTGLNRRTIQEALARLLAAEMLTVVDARIGRATTYALIKPAAPEPSTFGPSSSPSQSPSQPKGAALEAAPPAALGAAPPAAPEGSTTPGTSLTGGNAARAAGATSPVTPPSADVDRYDEHGRCHGCGRPKDGEVERHNDDCRLGGQNPATTCPECGYVQPLDDEDPEDYFLHADTCSHA